MLTITQVENQIKLFSLAQQLRLLSYIANAVSQRGAELTSTVKTTPKRQPGGLTGKFYIADDFDQTPDDFQEYV